ncbi:MAG: conjugal transfer protein TraN [Candidatus Midichloria sp.]|nr:conjugal transfer protein TraN [Candidatus Midichloria sp.]
MKSQGCMLEISNCIKKSGNICLLWQKNYSCIESQKKLSSSIVESQIFCLGGDCYNPTIQANTDIENIAYLAALNEMKKDMQINPIRVFSGEGKACKRNMLNFLNCCSGLQGWSKDLGLSQCTKQILCIKNYMK